MTDLFQGQERPIHYANYRTDTTHAKHRDSFHDASREIAFLCREDIYIAIVRPINSTQDSTVRNTRARTGVRGTALAAGTSFGSLASIFPRALAAAASTKEGGQVRCGEGKEGVQPEE